MASPHRVLEPLAFLDRRPHRLGRRTCVTGASTESPDKFLLRLPRPSSPPVGQDPGHYSGITCTGTFGSRPQGLLGPIDALEPTQFRWTDPDPESPALPTPVLRSPWVGRTGPGVTNRGGPSISTSIEGRSRTPRGTRTPDRLPLRGAGGRRVLPSTAGEHSEVSVTSRRRSPTKVWRVKRGRNFTHLPEA